MDWEAAAADRGKSSPAHVDVLEKRIAALRKARAQGLVTIGFTGTKGEAMGVSCDHLLIAPSDDTPVIQQIHLAVAHGICDEIEQAMISEAPRP